MPAKYDKSVYSKNTWKIKDILFRYKRNPNI